MCDTCFALKDHREYYVARNECYALKYPEYKKMVRLGHCGTKRCPFYKYSRANVRVGMDIYRNSDKREVLR